MATKSDPRSITLRAFGLLDALALAPEPVPLQELARATRLPKPSAHRIAQMMEQADLIARAPQGGYEPGAALRRLAFAVVSRGATTEATRSVLRAVVEETGESCALAVLDGVDVTFLEHVESTWPLRLSIAAGTRLPAHCTAAGKLLLAQLPPARRERLLAGLPRTRYTTRTILDAALLAQALSEARAAGFATEVEEYLAGLVAVAVPIRAPGRGVIAALTLLVPSARSDLAALTAHVPMLALASERLGGILIG